MTKLSLAREQLVKMYIHTLEEQRIPWRMRWINGTNVNGVTKCAYRGINQLILSTVSFNRKYDDSRWFTFVQIKKNGYKLKNAKNMGVPIEFWSVYDLKNKKKIDFVEYEKIIEANPEEKANFRVICNTTFVYNATHIEGVPKIETNTKGIKISNYINNIIKVLGVKYSEYGKEAFYRPSTDEIVLPPRNNFVDKYSYYATQLHELCHSTGNEKRLNRNISLKDEQEYAREELIAEISSSFLMQNLHIDVKAEHYDNHKSYIQSWIKILKNNPQELFKAINESNKVCDYIDDLIKEKKKEKEVER